MEQYGQAGLNSLCTKISSQLALMSESATNVTPLVIVNPKQTLAAWRVEVSNAFRTGRIRRICISCQKHKGETMVDILLRLKGIFGEKSVSYSVVCDSPARTCVYISYSKPTTG